MRHRRSLPGLTKDNIKKMNPFLEVDDNAAAVQPNNFPHPARGDKARCYLCLLPKINLLFQDKCCKRNDKSPEDIEGAVRRRFSRKFDNMPTVNMNLVKQYKKKVCFQYELSIKMSLMLTNVPDASRYP